MNFLLLAALVRVSWIASVQPPSVESYRVCWRVETETLKSCTSTSALFSDLSLDSEKNWFISVEAVNADGSSLPVKEVFVPAGSGSQWESKYKACSTTNFQMNELNGRLRKICGKKCAKVY